MGVFLFILEALCPSPRSAAVPPAWLRRAAAPTQPLLFPPPPCHPHGYTQTAWKQVHNSEGKKINKFFTRHILLYCIILTKLTLSTWCYQNTFTIWFHYYRDKYDYTLHEHDYTFTVTLVEDSQFTSSSLRLLPLFETLAAQVLSSCKAQH